MIEISRRWLAPFVALAVGVAFAQLFAIWAPAASPLVFEVPLWLRQFALAADIPIDAELMVSRPDRMVIVGISLAPFIITTAYMSQLEARIAQIALQTLTRLCLLFSLGLILAQPTLSTPINDVTIVIVADLSDSLNIDHNNEIEKNTDEIRSAFSDAYDPDHSVRKSKLRFVGYGAVAQAFEIPIDPEAPFDLRAIQNSVGAWASNHAEALQMAQALIEPDTHGRIILLSDGTGTQIERNGLFHSIQDLQQRGFEVHTRHINAPRQGDIVLSAIHLPSQLQLGQTFELVIDVESNHAYPLEIGLHQNGEENSLEAKKIIELKPGRQQIRFPSRLAKAGPVRFEAFFESAKIPKDINVIRENDRIVAIGEVQGQPQILHIGRDRTRALSRALASDHFTVQDTSASQFPKTEAALKKFDLIVLSDIASNEISREGQRALAKHVKQRGAGLVMVGGEHSFGLGDWDHSPLAEILPVTFFGEKQRSQPTLALLLVIDKSGSMSSQDKLDLVKEAARLTGRSLDPSDELGVIAFDSRPQVLVRLQSAANRLRISSSIRRLSAGGGTNALPALREAYLQLAGSNARIKHVILLSDGQSPTAGIEALLADMRDAAITVSTVGVGAGAGKDFLARIAEQGSGRYYFSLDGLDVPRIFSRETKEVTKNAVVETNFYPRVTKTVQALRGIDFSSAPALGGLVPLRPKALAEVLMRSHTGDPLLIRGRRGLGRCTVFASDAQPRWAGRWISWSSFGKFWSQIARDTMRQEASGTGGATLRARTGERRDTWQIHVEANNTGQFHNDLRAELEIVDPQSANVPFSPKSPENHSGTGPSSSDLRDLPPLTASPIKRSLPLDLCAPGRYCAQIHQPNIGQYLLRAKLFRKETQDQNERLIAQVVHHVATPLAAESHPDFLKTNERWIHEIAEISHQKGSITKIVTSPSTIQHRNRQEELWPIFLWALTIPLLLLDLACRRWIWPPASPARHR